MAKMLEVAATLFFWWLGIYVSFLPAMTNHHKSGGTDMKSWEKNVNIVILTLFIGSILNLVEKIIIQLIAISFHTRTYADRIELNKFQISALSRLYRFAKIREKSISSGNTIGPKAVFQQARQGAQQAIYKVGDVVGKIAGDFTGKEVTSSTSPQQVVLTLLQTTEGGNVVSCLHVCLLYVHF
jgi:type IV secretory pathway VirB3-like protein